MAIRLKLVAKEALVATMAAAWVVGLVHQFKSWSMTAVYLAISLAIVGVVFGNQLLPKFASRKNRRR
jgi:hypothetical protein